MSAGSVDRCAQCGSAVLFASKRRILIFLSPLPQHILSSFRITCRGVLSSLLRPDYMSRRWVLLVPLLVADIHALFVPAQSCGRRLEKSEIERLSVQRYVSIPGWLSDVQTDRLQADAAAVGACEHIFDCCVGSADGGARVDESVRLTRQCTFFPPPPNEAGSIATRARLIDAVQSLRGELQASMALPSLEPFETELSYLLYRARPGHSNSSSHAACAPFTPCPLVHRSCGWPLPAPSRHTTR